MNIIKKPFRVGDSSYGIILDRKWINYTERKHGKKLEAVIIEGVDDNLLIKPYFSDLESKSEAN